MAPFRLRCVLVALSLSWTGFACTTDDQCNYNGICTNGGCVCFAGWMADDCGALKFKQATNPNGYNLTAHGTSSWCGSVVPDPANHELYHLFASEITNGCGLDSWSPYSRIIRAESTNGSLGPYTFAAEVVGTFAHNPTVIWSPADALYLLYHIGCPQSPPAGCDNSFYFQCGPGNNIQGESGVSVLSSSDLINWTPWGMVLNGSGTDSWNGDLTNPSPFGYADKMLVAYRGCNYNGAGTEQIGLAHTVIGNYAGYYDLGNSQLFSDANEDPFIWQDPQGHFHMLLHSVNQSIGGGSSGQPLVGRHAYAACWNCTWTFNKNTVAYNTTVEFIDGSSKTYYRRERPQLGFDQDGTPIFLVTGVQEFNVPSSYTIVQAIGSPDG